MAWIMVAAMEVLRSKHSEYILLISGFADTLNVGVREKEQLKVSPKVMT